MLAALGRCGNGHLTEVETDLQQTAYLLSEAIGKLGSSFIGIHAAVVAQQDAINALRGAASMTPAVQSTLSSLQLETARHAHAAVTALQFQDMTNQLIGRIIGHVDSLDLVLREVGDASTSLAGDGSDTGMLATIEALNRMLVQRETTQDHVSRKAVAQTHMESGDIELF